MSKDVSGRDPRIQCLEHGLDPSERFKDYSASLCLPAPPPTILRLGKDTHSEKE